MIIISDKENYLKKELIINSVRLLFNEDFIKNTNTPDTMLLFEDFIEDSNRTGYTTLYNDVKKVDINSEDIELIYLKDGIYWPELYNFNFELLNRQYESIKENIYHILQNLNDYLPRKKIRDIRLDLLELGRLSKLDLKIRNSKVTGRIDYNVFIGIELLRRFSKSELKINNSEVTCWEDLEIFIRKKSIKKAKTKNRNNSIKKTAFNSDKFKKRFKCYYDVVQEHDIFKNYNDYTQKNIINKLESNPIIGYKKNGYKVFLKNLDKYSFEKIIRTMRTYQGNKMSNVPYFNSAYSDPMWPFISACFLFKRDSILQFYINNISGNNNDEIYNKFFFTDIYLNYLFKSDFSKLYNQLEDIKGFIESGNKKNAISYIDKIIDHLDTSGTDGTYIMFDTDKLPTKSELTHVIDNLKEWHILGDSIQFDINKFFRGLYIHLARKDGKDKQSEIIPGIIEKFYSNNYSKASVENNYYKDYEVFKDNALNYQD